MMSQPALTLSRPQVSALLFALDDADAFFSHPKADAILALWRRLHLALCYLDGEQGFTGTPEERELSVSSDEAAMLDDLLNVATVMSQPPNYRESLREVLRLCREYLQVRV